MSSFLKSTRDQWKASHSNDSLLDLISGSCFSDAEDSLLSSMYTLLPSRVSSSEEVESRRLFVASPSFIGSWVICGFWASSCECCMLSIGLSGLMGVWPCGVFCCVLFPFSCWSVPLVQSVWGDSTNFANQRFCLRKCCWRSYLARRQIHSLILQTSSQYDLFSIFWDS